MQSSVVAGPVAKQNLYVGTPAQQMEDEGVEGLVANLRHILSQLKGEWVDNLETALTKAEEFDQGIKKRNETNSFRVADPPASSSYHQGMNNEQSVVIECVRTTSSINTAVRLIPETHPQKGEITKLFRLLIKAIEKHSEERKKPRVSFLSETGRCVLV